MTTASQSTQYRRNNASVKRGVKDMTAMSKTTCSSLALDALSVIPHQLSTFRTQLTAIMFFCMAATMAPHALAQPACGASISLSANQWTMVGIPCVPAAANKTVGKMFGPSLGTTNYGVTWIVWKRVYDNNQCVVASGPADCYIKQTLNSAANTGDAFWIYTTEHKTLQFSSTSTATPGPSFEFPATLSTDGNSRYYMFANPYSATVNWSDLGFSTLLFGIIPVIGTTQQAINLSVVSKNVYYWNGNTYFTRDLTAPQATFAAKQAVWLEMLQPDPAIVPSVSVQVPKP
jgi:hypothetical protein